MIKFRFKPIYFTALAVFAFSCTDLEVEELDSVVIEDAAGRFSGVEPGPALEAAYNDLRGFADQANLYALLEVTSDELLVPTRGGDWGDGGTWRSLHQHTFSPTHPFLLATWNNLNGNAYRTNQILSEETMQNFNPTAQQIAEAKFLRAYNLFLVLDLWGKFPFKEAAEPYYVAPVVYEGQEAVNFLLNDLQEALPNLPAKGPGQITRQATQAAAHFLLAKIYLNKHLYVENETTASDADMNKVIEHVDAIKAAGFGLEDGYFEIFEPTADKETIFWTNASVGNRIWNTLHYHQRTPTNQGGGWNGFATTADFYALFEGPSNTNAPNQGQEERRGYVPKEGIGYGFLFGQQYAQNGDSLKDRAGNPLSFTKDFPIIGATESDGIRVIKYHPSTGDYAEHYILFRYADAHLMKAEAYARMGNMDRALELINELRALRKASQLEPGEFNLMEILNERGRELYIEGWRRNDQIRFGVFDDTWPLKEITDQTRVRFPIPPSAVSSNPNLEQNPGY